jgi:hypothetical protein
MLGSDSFEVILRTNSLFAFYVKTFSALRHSTSSVLAADEGMQVAASGWQPNLFTTLAVCADVKHRSGGIASAGGRAGP